MYNVTYNVSPVVSHDTSSLDAQNASNAQPSAAAPNPGLLDTVAKFAAPANELVQLEIDCKNWEGTELATAHARLYQLLTRAYSFYLIMKTDADKKKRDDYKKALATFIELRNHKFLSTSDDMNRVVKAVFGSDRRRVSAYSIALKKALASGVPAADLASWFTAQGGVEEVRSARSITNTDQVPDHEKAATSLADQVLMRIKPDAVTMPMGVEDNDKPIVLLAVYRPTGDLELKAIVNDAAVVKAAYGAFYKEHKEAIEAANKIAADSKADAIARQLAKFAA